MDYLHATFWNLIGWLLEIIPALLKGALILLIGLWVASLCRKLVLKSGSRLKWEAALTDYLARTAQVVALTIFVIAALNKMGFPVSSLLATLGISGIIIGLGLRGQIANYFAGVMMLAARPFKQGDLIEFGPPPQIGKVVNVCMTFTALDTLDNVRIIVPNAVLWRNRIYNFSVHQQRAIKIPITLKYDTNVDWVRRIALDVLKRHDAVLNDPAPSFTLSDVTADNVRAQLTAWSQVDNLNVFGAVVIQMRDEFKLAGLEVTVPSKDIDLKREE